MNGFSREILIATHQEEYLRGPALRTLGGKKTYLFTHSARGAFAGGPGVGLLHEQRTGGLRGQWPGQEKALRQIAP
jgi:hypothetical protein